MFLIFPTIKTHDFADHLRTPEAGPSIVRYMFVARAEDSSAENAVRIGIQVTLWPLPAELKSGFATASSVELAIQASPARVFLRRKLGFSPAGGGDPSLAGIIPMGKHGLCPPCSVHAL